MTLIADKDDSALEQNRRRLIQDFRREAAQYERRYEIPSSQVKTALAEGRLQETAEIAAWLLILAALVLLSRNHARPSRPE